MNARQREKKVNAIVDEILEKDQENDFDATQTASCPGGCEKLNNTKKAAQDPKDGKFLSPQTPRQCRCGVENSSRFSLRVMEAMRSLQRDVDQPSTSTIKEIIDYITSHYRHDGDLYAQVRTALRQVCSQGFAMELLSNEYHLVGPVVSSIKRNGCSWDCKGRTIDDASRRLDDDQRNGTCGCARFPRRSPRQDPRLRGETLRASVVDRFEEPIFHSTKISADERNGEFNADVSDDRRRRGRIKMERRDDVEPIPGPSRRFLETPARNAKKARVEDRGMHRVDEKDDEITTEEDMDCTCGAEVVARDEHSRIRPLDRRRRRVVVRNGRRRNGAEEAEDEEDEERGMERENAREEDVGEKMEEEDEDTEEDSAYEELRARAPRRRTTARERELKKWIRRCRQECERRRRR